MSRVVYLTLWGSGHEWQQTDGAGAIPGDVAGTGQPRGAGCSARCGDVLQLMLCDSLTGPPGTAGAAMPSSGLSVLGSRTTALIVSRRRGELAPRSRKGSGSVGALPGRCSARVGVLEGDGAGWEMGQSLSRDVSSVLCSPPDRGGARGR